MLPDFVVWDRAGPSPGTELPLGLCVQGEPCWTITPCRKGDTAVALCPLVRTEGEGSAATRLLLLGPLSQQQAGGECKWIGEGAKGVSILQEVS